MNCVYRFLALVALLVASLLGAMSAQNGFVETDLVANKSPLTDANGIVHTPVMLDPNLVNPWGVGENATSPFWISDNNAGVSTLYRVNATVPVAIQPLVVSIPTPGDPLGNSGTPTGLVFNITTGGATPGFKISGVDATGKPATAPAVFLFSTEDGTILGWNPGVNPVGFDPVRDKAKVGKLAVIAVDNSTNPDAANGAVYKGLAIATDSGGRTLLYATNFRSGKVEVYDNTFAPQHDIVFSDPQLKKGYAPFNIVPINGKLFVTYAVQDETRHDDLAGMSHGIVDIYNLDGSGQERFAQHGQLNSPWGVAVAPASFGQFAGDILIGNFGNGHINVYSPDGEFLDKLRDPNGQAIVIDGLWTLRVGNGGNGGLTNTVYFTAGPNGESDGLFGSLAPQQ